MPRGEAYRCLSHTDRFAVGKCNACGKSFCGECLHIYNLNAEGARATLYLCPNCLRERYVEEADLVIYGGIIFLLLGVILVFLLPSIGIILTVIAVGAMVYGHSKKAGMPKELTIDEIRIEEKKREAELSKVGTIAAEEMYSELLTRYATHWGAATGIELLQNEITAYTRRGMSFSEAVEKVYQRQEKKPY